MDRLGQPSPRRGCRRRRCKRARAAAQSNRRIGRRDPRTSTAALGLEGFPMAALTRPSARAGRSLAKASMRRSAGPSARAAASLSARQVDRSGRLRARALAPLRRMSSDPGRWPTGLPHPTGGGRCMGLAASTRGRPAGAPPSAAGPSNGADYANCDGAATPSWPSPAASCSRGDGMPRSVRSRRRWAGVVRKRWAGPARIAACTPAGRGTARRADTSCPASGCGPSARCRSPRRSRRWS